MHKGNCYIRYLMQTHHHNYGVYLFMYILFAIVSFDIEVIFPIQTRVVAIPSRLQLCRRQYYLIQKKKK